MAIVLVAPQQKARTDAVRKDDLRKVAAIVALNEKPGDAVLYQPWGARVAGLAYPQPFLRLRNIGMLETPLASATLTGVPVSPAELARRLGAAGWRSGGSGWSAGSFRCPRPPRWCSSSARCCAACA